MPQLPVQGLVVKVGVNCSVHIMIGHAVSTVCVENIYHSCTTFYTNILLCLENRSRVGLWLCKGNYVKQVTADLQLAINIPMKSYQLRVT